ncbi:unnamed protein product [Soboliphyme baturini]|uniref:Uncharacterized protein n=1 Tax=Soboliphyme baturini TaxID=241478 RepID=A0A183IF85_9BILA|nr:unnamed protein product [Soboliphyme baturini]
MLGGIVGFLLIVLAIFLLVCVFRHKRKSDSIKKTFNNACQSIRREHSSLLEKKSDETKFRSSPSLTPTPLSSNCSKNGCMNLYSNPNDDRPDFSTSSSKLHSNLESRTLKQICSQPSSVADTHQKGGDDPVPAMPLLDSCDGVFSGNKQQFCTFKPNHPGLLDLTSPLLFRNRLSDGYYSDSQ